MADVKSFKMGTVERFDNFINAVIDEVSFDKLAKYIDQAKADGQEIIVGGNYDKSKGYFIEPTVIVAKDPKYTTMCEELFGPVLTLYVYEDDKWEETLDLVNTTSPYALTGAVFSQDRYALEVANADYARLEVSSPGLDRPLKTPEHYVRFTGLEVEITLKMPFQGRKKYKGVLESVPAAEGVADAQPSWQVVFKQGEGKNAVEQALGFTLDEVREARLVPVVDFKGRGRRAASPLAQDLAVDEAQELGDQKK